MSFSKSEKISLRLFAMVLKDLSEMATTDEKLWETVKTVSDDLSQLVDDSERMEKGNALKVKSLCDTVLWSKPLSDRTDRLHEQIKKLRGKDQ